MIKTQIKRLRDLGPTAYLAYRREISLEGKLVAPPKEGFEGELLGEGKDGVVYRVDGDSGLTIEKRYKPFGSRFARRAEQAVATLSDDPSVYDVEFFAEGYRYVDEGLQPVGYGFTSFVSGLLELARAEQRFIRNGYLYTDFGASEPNYRFDRAYKLKIIDYGGNAFLRLDGAEAAPLSTHRLMLNSPNSDYVKAQFLGHILVFGLGRVDARHWLSLSQYGTGPTRRGLKWCLRALEGTAFWSLSRLLQRSDVSLLESEGWLRLEEALCALVADPPSQVVQERADIDAIDVGTDRIRVKGYQDYDIVAGEILFHSRQKLWDTRAKSELVAGAMDRFSREHDAGSSTMLDIGCNLGAYVFMGRLNYGFASALGADYNRAYVEACASIASAAKINDCSFIEASFADLTEPVDLLLMMGLIHHLFQRTEQIGDLDPILSSVRKLTRKAAVIEFPTENDPKAKKWVALPGREVGDYSKVRFLECAQRHFTDVEEIGGVTSERPVYYLRC